MLAPTAARTANSFCRASARDHSRLARLVQAIAARTTRRRPGRPSNMRDCRATLVAPPLDVDALTSLFALKLLRDLIADGPHFGSACSKLTPGFSRAITCR